MKKSKNAGVLYLVYLAGILIFLFVIISFDGGSISMANISYVIDFFTAVFVVGICLLSLICTGTLRGFKNAVVFIFGNSEYTAGQIKDSILSLKVIFASALLGSSIAVVAQIINVVKNLEIGISAAGAQIDVALIAWLYGLVICIAILPMYFLLKRTENQR